ncbi:hypothetical protein [Paenibacillus sp. NAIST15-1]|uniref:hypothetical protein n=1 Tax=Paenibacillus sp. NAIST15-1 TaxID=1605994 RepID=UPI00086C1566|nr:hypothetical protein [Paenibacillus sp. NAIST15-1]GAV11370.1 hypothetical protein PBN151_1297 [Paenibacillus sp. NAIST15-1]
MTAINFIYEENQVTIYMDTLSLDLNRRPLKFVSKIYPIPHLKTVICGTGNMDLILDWVYFVQRKLTAADIAYLREITSETLSELNKKYPPDISTTIYQFGYSQIDEKIKGYAYRSTNSFNQEEYDYGFGIKPQIDFDFGSEVDLESAFVHLMIKQKENDDLSPTRIGIGGEIQRLIMKKDTFLLQTIHRFSDFDECYAEILENLKNYK